MNIHAVQHFWLCDDCRTSYSLEYRDHTGVLIRAHSVAPRAHKSDRVIAVA